MPAFLAAALFAAPAALVGVFSFPFDRWTIVAAAIATPALCGALAGAVVLGNRWHRGVGYVAGVGAIVGYLVFLQRVEALLRSALG